MKRRQFIVTVGAAMAWPLVAHAQQREQKRRAAVLMGGLKSGDPGAQDETAALEAGLKELGWTPGGNLALDYHWPGAELDDVRAAAQEIARARPDVVVSRSTPATAAIMGSGLPIVFVLVVDPMGSGFVQSLGHPGYNLTGFSNFEASVAGKWLALLKEAAPAVSRATVLFNPTTAPFSGGYLVSAQAAAPSLGVTLTAGRCANAADIESAMTVRAQEGGGGVVVITDTFLTEHRDLILDLAGRYRLPAVYGSSTFIPGGGMIVYSADYPDIYRRAAGYVDRILHGARPAELPVQEPAKFSLTVNVKTARAIGLTLPQSLVARADAVIE
jgi:putative ABC transport system substrate-binding protein